MKKIAFAMWLAASLFVFIYAQETKPAVPTAPTVTADQKIECQSFQSTDKDQLIAMQDAQIKYNDAMQKRRSNAELFQAWLNEQRKVASDKHYHFDPVTMAYAEDKPVAPVAPSKK